MTETDRLKYLRIALLLVGAILVVGICPLTIIWPSGWSWHTGQSEYFADDPRDLRDAGVAPKQQ